MSDIKEVRLAAMLTEQASGSASERLRGRVENLASFHASSASQRAASTRRFRFAALAAACGIGSVALIALAPTAISARTLNKLSQAMDGTTSLHVRMVDVAKNPPSVVNEVWYQNGAWRISDQMGGTTVWKDGTSYIFNPLANTLVKRAQPEGPFTKGVKSFKMSALLEQMTGDGGGKNVEVTNRNEKTYQLSFENSLVQERYIYVVDTKTDLPQTFEADSRVAGVWTKRVFGALEFNQPISNDLFKPNTSPGVRQIDLDDYKSKLASQFEGKVAFLTNGSPKGGFLIRDAEVTSRGSVFLTYTGSGISMNRWLELTDDRGIRYVRADMYNQGGFSDRELDAPGLNGLRVGWWVPEDPVGPFTPRTFTLTLKRNKRKSDDSYFARPAIEVIGRTKFTVRTPTPTPVPMFLMIVGPAGLPKTELDLKRGEAYSRSLQYLHEFVTKDGKPAGIPGISEGGPSSGLWHDKKSLEKALVSAQQEVDYAHEYIKLGGEDTSGYGYQHLFEATRLLGRTKESDAYLQQAERVSDSWGKEAKIWIQQETMMGNLPVSGSKP